MKTDITDETSLSDSPESKPPVESGSEPPEKTTRLADLNRVSDVDDDEREPQKKLVRKPDPETMVEATHDRKRNENLA